jgi:glycosyltransferase involved in cell wall biosynthesis
VAFDMTFADRNRGGTRVYARSLFASLRESDSVATWVISGPKKSGIAGTMEWLLRGARRAVMAKPPDILHCPSFVAPWRVPVPFVVTVHDAAGRRYPRDHPLEWRMYDRRFLGRRLRAAARVITGSEFARKEVVDVYRLRPDRVVVVPYGLDPRILSAPVAEVPAQEATILFPGAPVGRKNLEAILEVMASAGDGSALGRAQLEISGATEAQFPRQAERIESLGLRSRVRWLGHVPSEQMMQTIARAAVVAYPSLYEGFGFPPLEAMALGTPVVASNRGSLPEVLGDAALLVDPGDRRALSEALESALTRAELRDRLRQAGLVRARTFTWNRCAEQTQAVYRVVLRETRGLAA